MTPLIDYFYTLSKEEQIKMEKDYHNWVQFEPCCITNSSNVGIPHHLRYPGYATRYCGASMKPPDIFEMPMIFPLHYEVEHGVLTFEKKHNVDLIAKLKEVQEKFMFEFNIKLH